MHYHVAKVIGTHEAKRTDGSLASWIVQMPIHITAYKLPDCCLLRQAKDKSIQDGKKKPETQMIEV